MSDSGNMYNLHFGVRKLLPYPVIMTPIISGLITLANITCVAHDNEVREA